MPCFLPPQVLFSYVWELTILGGSMNAVSVAGGVCVMAGVVSVGWGVRDVCVCVCHGWLEECEVGWWVWLWVSWLVSGE